MLNEKNPSHISVIGLGSLGGFLVKNLNDIDFVKEITIVDFDKVQNHNLNNSIYTSDDIGKYKTWALWSKLLYSRKKLNTITDQYVGNNINFSSSDIVIDCRDILTNNDPQITFKAFITGHYLCISNKIYDDDTVHEGRYLYPTDKTIIKYAAYKISTMVESNIIFDILKSNSTHLIEILDIQKEFHLNENKIEHGSDCIVDDNAIYNKVSNLRNLSDKIIKTNKRKPICLKTMDSSFNKHIDIGGLDTIEDLNQYLYPVVMNNPLASKSYLLQMTSDRYGNVNIEIVPFCGGA